MSVAVSITVSAAMLVQFMRDEKLQGPPLEIQQAAKCYGKWGLGTVKTKGIWRAWEISGIEDYRKRQKRHALGDEKKI